MEHVNAAMRDVALAALVLGDALERLSPEVKYPPQTWRIAPEPAELENAPWVHRPRGKQETPEYVEPFDVDADWSERA